MLLLFHRKVLDNVWVGVNSYCFVSHLYCPTELAWHAGIHLIVCQVSSLSFPLGYQKQKSSVFLTVLIRCHLQPLYLSPVLSIFLSRSLSLSLPCLASLYCFFHSLFSLFLSSFSFPYVCRSLSVLFPCSLFSSVCKACRTWYFTLWSVWSFSSVRLLGLEDNSTTLPIPRDINWSVHSCMPFLFKQNSLYFFYI